LVRHQREPLNNLSGLIKWLRPKDLRKNSENILHFRVVSDHRRSTVVVQFSQEIQNWRVVDSVFWSKPNVVLNSFLTSPEGINRQNFNDSAHETKNTNIVMTTCAHSKSDNFRRFSSELSDLLAQSLQLFQRTRTSDKLLKVVLPVKHSFPFKHKNTGTLRRRWYLTKHANQKVDS
jgi:hypothetical protein